MSFLFLLKSLLSLCIFLTLPFFQKVKSIPLTKKIYSANTNPSILTILKTNSLLFLANPSKHLARSLVNRSGSGFSKVMLKCKPVSTFAYATPDSLSIQSISSEDERKLIRHFLPSLDDPRLYKGKMGRIGVIGGSEIYCGAPYYAAMSTLKIGADLVYVFTDENACGPIKSFSPELMVLPAWRNEIKLDSEQEKTKQPENSSLYNCNDNSRLESSFRSNGIDFIREYIDQNRLHSLVIGPGLGRAPAVQEMVIELVNYCKSKIKSSENIVLPLIIDADGLWAITAHPRGIECINGYGPSCILTPNAIELGRLMTRMKGDDITKAKPFVCETDAHTKRALEDLSSFLGGVTIIAKGEVDHITQPLTHSNALNKFHDCEVKEGKISQAQESKKNYYSFLHQSVKASKGNCPRRCGGLGDILAGTVAVFQHWCTLKQQDTLDKDDETTALKACKASAILVRLASLRTYHERGRGMTAPDVIDTLSKVIQEIDFSMNEDIVGDEQEGTD